MLISTKKDLRKYLDEWHHDGSIGLVPTMGALHAGHVSLIRRAAAENRRVIVSDFVNPAQFGVDEDYSRYPRDLDADLSTAIYAGADLIFAPSVTEMYGDSRPVTSIDPGPMARLWEGATRPFHFAGVALIVTKLLSFIQPRAVYFGEKDFQQYRVVQSIVGELDIPTRVIAGPTVRDKDGLALSSRNRYLSPEQRIQAVVIPQALSLAQTSFAAGQTDPRALENIIISHLDTAPDLGIGYVALVDPQTLQSVQGPVNPTTRILLAAHIGTTRLIDNAALAPTAPTAATAAPMTPLGGIL